MTYNMQMITEHAPTFRKLYFEKFNKQPKSWFGFFRWLSDCTAAQSFNSEERDLAIKLLEV